MSISKTKNGSDVSHQFRIPNLLDDLKLSQEEQEIIQLYTDNSDNKITNIYDLFAILPVSIPKPRYFIKVDIEQKDENSTDSASSDAEDNDLREKLLKTIKSFAKQMVIFRKKKIMDMNALQNYLIEMYKKMYGPELENYCVVEDLKKISYLEYIELLLNAIPFDNNCFNSGLRDFIKNLNDINIELPEIIDYSKFGFKSHFGNRNHEAIMFFKVLSEIGGKFECKLSLICMMLLKSAKYIESQKEIKKIYAKTLSNLNDNEYTALIDKIAESNYSNIEIGRMIAHLILNDDRFMKKDELVNILCKHKFLLRTYLATKAQSELVEEDLELLRRMVFNNFTLFKDADVLLTTIQKENINFSNLNSYNNILKSKMLIALYSSNSKEQFINKILNDKNLHGYIQCFDTYDFKMMIDLIFERKDCWHIIKSIVNNFKYSKKKLIIKLISKKILSMNEFNTKHSEYFIDFINYIDSVSVKSYCSILSNLIIGNSIPRNNFPSELAELASNHYSFKCSYISSKEEFTKCIDNIDINNFEPGKSYPYLIKQGGHVFCVILTKSNNGQIFLTEFDSMGDFYHNHDYLTSLKSSGKVSEVYLTNQDIQYAGTDCFYFSLYTAVASKKYFSKIFDKNGVPKVSSKKINKDGLVEFSYPPVLYTTSNDPGDIHKIARMPLDPKLEHRRKKHMYCKNGITYNTKIEYFRKKMEMRFFAHKLKQEAMAQNSHNSNAVRLA